MDEWKTSYAMLGYSRMFVFAATAAASALRPDECNASVTSDADVHGVCKAFCSNKCSFYNSSDNETPTRENITIYRISPKNVTDLANHDTGDAPGDIGFFLSEKALKAECERNPTDIACFLAGENVYVSWLVEIDGKFGPYHMCNPTNGNASGTWQCLQYCEDPPKCAAWSSQHDSLGWMGPNCYCERSNRTVGRVKRTPHYTNHGSNPKWWPTQQCSVESHMSSAEGYCLNSTVYKTLPNALPSECCAACGTDVNCHGWVMPNGSAVSNASAPGHARDTCSLVGEPFSYHRVDPVTSTCLSAYKPGGGAGHISGGVFGGYWYSFPKPGKCAEGSRPGDGTSTCTWRIVQQKKIVNASCVNDKVDRVVENFGKECFQRCPGGVKNSTSTCYLDCYAVVINGNDTATPPVKPISTQTVIKEWLGGFESDDIKKGGCPPV